MVSSRQLSAFVAIATIAFLNPDVGQAAKPLVERVIPFAAEVAPLINASLELDPPIETDIDVLISVQKLRFERDGRRTSTSYRVVRYLTRRAVSEQGILTEQWSPWQSAKPELRARVISPDGSVHPLQPGAIVESALGRESQNVFTDDRVLEAPLPALEPGCLVEIETVSRELETFCAAGVVEVRPMAGLSHIHSRRFVVEYPSDHGLRVLQKGISASPTKSTTGGLARLQYDLNTTPAIDLESLEDNAPADVAQLPQIRMSTGRSWKDIAHAYGSLLKPATSPRVKAIVNSLVKPGMSRDEIVSACRTYMRTKIRYTGLEFGRQSIVPRSPDETLLSRYGDCKDQSSLMVAMLAAAGLRAHIALVNTYGIAHRVDSPGLDSFNHAIVCLPGTPTRWIDPTQSHQRVDELPRHLYGEFALIANSDGLSQIPFPASTQNHVRLDYTIDMTLTAKPKIHNVVTYRGGPESAIRSFYAATNEGDLRKAWEQISKNEYNATLSEFSHSKPDDMSTPFQVRTTHEDAQWGRATDSEAAISMDPVNDLLGRLPESLWAFEEPGPKRTYPMHLPEPHVVEVSYRIVPPIGFESGQLPSAEDKVFGPLSVASDFQRDGNAVIASYRVDTGDGKLSPDEVLAFQEFLVSRRVGNLPWSDVIEFRHSGWLAMESGDRTSALQKFQRAVEASPGNTKARTQFARALKDAGFCDAAAFEINQTLRMSPDDGDARKAAGFILSADRFGRDCGAGWDQHAALRALTRAKAVLKDDRALEWYLGMVCMFDDYGFLTSDPARLIEAEKHFADAVAHLAFEQPARRPQLLCWIHLKRLKQLINPAVFTAVPSFTLAAVTIDKGPAAAYRYCRSRLDQAATSRALLGAAEILDSMRQYESAELLLSTAMESGQPVSTEFEVQARSAILRMHGLKLAQQTTHGETSRIALLREYCQGLLTQGVYEARKLFQAGQRPVYPSTRERSTDHQLLGVETRVLKDMGFATLVECSRFAGQPDVLLIAKLNGKQTVIPTDSNSEHWGRLAWEHRNDGRNDVARQCLKEARNDYRSFIVDVKTTRQKYFSSTPFVQYFDSLTSQELADARQTNILSSILLSSAAAETQESLTTLVRAEQSERNQIRKVALQRTLLQSHIKNNRRGAMELANHLYSYAPDAIEPVEGMMRILLRNQITETLDRLTKTIGERPDKRWQKLADEYKVRAAISRGDFASAINLLHRSGRAADMESLLAWSVIAYEDQSPMGSFDSLFASAPTYFATTEAGSRLALAFQFASSNRDNEAIELLIMTLETSSNPEEFEAETNLVQARRAESIGLRAIAEWYYQQANKTADTSPIVTTLANSGLERLQTRPNTAKVAREPEKLNR